MNVGQRIKNRRKELNMSVDKLANLIGKNRATIYRYEKNEIENMPYDVIEPLSEVLKVSPAYLMGWIDEEQIHEDSRVTLYQDISENLEEVSEYNAPLVNSFIEEILKEQKGKSTLIPKTTKAQLQLSFQRQQRVYAYTEHQLTVQNENGNKLIDFNNSKNEKELVDVYGYASAGTGEALLDNNKFQVAYSGHVPPHDIALQINGDSMEPMFEDKEIIFIDKTDNINSGQIGVFIVDGEAYVKKIFIESDHLRLVSLNKKYSDIYCYENNKVELIGRVIL